LILTFDLDSKSVKSISKSVRRSIPWVRDINLPRGKCCGGECESIFCQTGCWVDLWRSKLWGWSWGRFNVPPNTQV